MPSQGLPTTTAANVDTSPVQQPHSITEHLGRRHVTRPSSTVTQDQHYTLTRSRVDSPITAHPLDRSHLSTYPNHPIHSTQPDRPAHPILPAHRNHANHPTHSQYHHYRPLPRPISMQRSVSYPVPPTLPAPVSSEACCPVSGKSINGRISLLAEVALLDAGQDPSQKGERHQQGVAVGAADLLITPPVTGWTPDIASGLGKSCQCADTLDQVLEQQEHKRFYRFGEVSLTIQQVS